MTDPTLPTGHDSPSAFWSGLSVLVLLGALGAVVARVVAGPRFDGLLMAAALCAAFLLLLRIPATNRQAVAQAPPVDPVAREIFDSAGPMIIAVGMDGCITQMNPAAERLLGYHAEELVGTQRTAEILAPGEGPRIIAELQKLSGIEPHGDLSPPERLAVLMDSVRALPPSQVPSFEAQFLRSDGATLPVTIHISALRSGEGMMEGLIVVAFDRSATMRQEQAMRESQERYRDLFENSTEMIATLSTSGQFLYANPAWKRCFGLDNSSLLALNTFEEIFGPGARGEVAALFRRALDGEMIDRSPVRNYTSDGRVLDFELSLSQRQKAGNPLAVRCLLRDVTQQRQRENRLALQLVVSQIIGENTSPDVAAMRILEALCASQGWDLAVKWEVNSEENRLEFSTAWGAPGRQTEAIIQESMGLTLSNSLDLPGRVWQEGRTVWVSDLAANSVGPRSRSALRHEMVSGWAVPVRVGNKILAILEFYTRHLLREDNESIAAIETVATSLGQMLARTRERGRAEELYRQQEILLDSVADGICGVDRHGMVSFANPAAARLLGSSVPSLIGKPAHELLHGSAPAGQRCGADCSLRRAAERQTAGTGEGTIFRSDGTSVPAEYFFTPIRDHGRFSGSVLSFRDISQRYALDRMKDEFISTVSHELRTPLTSIRGALGLLSSGVIGSGMSEKAANLLRIATTNSDRLVRLINDILDLERIQSGRAPITFRTVQLSQLVHQAIDGMQPVADAAGVQLIHDTTQVEIEGDADRLLQVLTNLLSNAIKFSSPNSAISIMMRPGMTGVTLSVIDQGRGIPADKLESIFGRFQQVDASDSRQKGGSGLGLAICRTIVMQHSGRIWAERNPVRGSTFRVYLPYQPTPSAGEDTGTMAQGTVLLADSNAVTRPRMAEQLSRHGYKVVEASSVDQTLEAAGEGVNAILLDTSLDGMNGWKLLPLLREKNPDGRIPIVLLSVADQARPHRLAADAEGWVKKPVEEDALLGELARVLCGPGERARVLVIEDDEDLASVIGDVFARESIDVQVSCSRQAALDACETFRPHLLVLDIELPDGDGFNVVDWLRQHATLARIPLVVYSGRELQPAERRQLTLGPTHFLTKAQVQPQQLEALVLTLLRNSRQMEEVPPTEPAERIL